MNITEIISQLTAERDKIDAAIDALELLQPVAPVRSISGTAKTDVTLVAKKRGRGRPPLALEYFIKCDACGKAKTASRSRLCRWCGNAAAGRRKREAHAKKQGGPIELYCKYKDCDEPGPFPNAIELGQHETKAHFPATSHMGSQLSGII